MDNDKIKELFVDAINGISKQEAEAVKYDMLLDCINAIPNLFSRGYLIGRVDACDDWRVSELQEGLLQWIDNDIWDNQ